MKTAASFLEHHGLTKATPAEQENCAMHGASMSRHLLFVKKDGTEHWSRYYCQQCEVDKERAAREEARLSQKREREAALLARSGLTGRYLETTFANYLAVTDEQRKVLATCENFTRELTTDQGGGLWLIGPVGTGKSHLGAAMVNHLIRERGLPAKMASLRLLIRDLRATWRKESDATEDDVIQQYGKAPLMVLDEVGIGFGTEAEQTQLFDVIDLRYQLQRPTVLLSNLSPDGLREVLGDRLFDRLREGASVLVCDWKSHRG